MNNLGAVFFFILVALSCVSAGFDRRQSRDPLNFILGNRKMFSFLLFSLLIGLFLMIVYWVCVFILLAIERFVMWVGLWTFLEHGFGRCLCI